MQLEEFSALFNKNAIKAYFGGGFIFLFGILILFLALSDTGTEGLGTAGFVIIWILAILCIVIGAIAVIVPIKNKRLIKAGNHPLINAIKNQDSSFVLWFYEHIIEVTSGPAKNTSHQVWIFCKEKKKYILTIKKNKIDEVIEYLSSHFPNALVGFSDENQKTFKQLNK